MVGVEEVRMVDGGIKRWLCLVLPLTYPLTLWGQENDCGQSFCDQDEVLVEAEYEFTEYPGEEDRTFATEAVHNGWQHYFYSDNQIITLRHDNSYMKSLDQEGIETNRSSVRLEWDKLISDNLYLKFDGKAHFFWHEDRRIEGTDKSSEVEFPIREFYLQGSAGDFSGSIGRQVIIWGESQIAAVTDVISPRNITDFYFTSLDESRIGQDIARLNHYSDFGHVSLVYVIDPKPNEDPIISGDYNIEGYNVGELEIVGEAEDIDPGYGLNWKKPISNGDYSLMVAELSTNEAYYSADPNQANSDIRTTVYPRYQFVGGAMNLSLGEYSLNLEVAHKKDMPFQSSVSPTGIETRNVIEAATAITYNINGTSSAYIGGSSTYINSDVSTLEGEYKHSQDFAAGIASSFYYELISLSYDFQHQLEDKNSIHVLSLSYAATDNLFYNLDFFVLTAENKEVFAFYDQKSVLFRLEYQF